MILWEILTGHTPWHKQLRSIPDFIRNVGVEGKRPTIPDDCPPLLSRLITDCWAQNPQSRPTFESIVEANIFSQIIIESCIDSPDGQALWKRHFDNSIQVPWPRFLVGFATYFNIQLPRSYETDPKLTCLKMAMGDGPTVSTEQFGNSLAWYGPLRRGQVQAFLDRVFNIWSFEGFFGECSREEAERKLVDEKPGSLLIRLSSIPGHFALSARTKAGVFKHFKVMYADEAFHFDDQNPCTSLEQVIAIVKKANKIKYIVEGSKFKQNLVLKQQEDNRDANYTEIKTQNSKIRK
jgi:serine/threonine protein kinase